MKVIDTFCPWRILRFKVIDMIIYNVYNIAHVSANQSQIIDTIIYNIAHQIKIHNLITSVNHIFFLQKTIIMKYVLNMLHQENNEMKN